MQKRGEMDRKWFELSTKKLVLLGLMVALNVVLGRLNIQLTQEVRISVLGFLPVAVAGMLMGPVFGAITGAAGDVVNFLLFTHVYGPYFPGYTITYLLSGLWYGLVLYGRKPTWTLSVLAIVPVIMIGEIGLNSLWVYIMYYKTFWANLPMRIITNAIECPLKILLVVFIGRALERFPKSYLKL